MIITDIPAFVRERGDCIKNLEDSRYKDGMYQRVLLNQKSELEKTFSFWQLFLYKYLKSHCMASSYKTLKYIAIRKRLPEVESERKLFADQIAAENEIIDRAIVDDIASSDPLFKMQMSIFDEMAYANEVLEPVIHKAKKLSVDNTFFREFDGMYGEGYGGITLMDIRNVTINRVKNNLSQIEAGAYLIFPALRDKIMNIESIVHGAREQQKAGILQPTAEDEQIWEFCEKGEQYLAALAKGFNVYTFPHLQDQAAKVAALFCGIEDVTEKLKARRGDRIKQRKKEKGL